MHAAWSVPHPLPSNTHTNTCGNPQTSFCTAPKRRESRTKRRQLLGWIPRGASGRRHTIYMRSRNRTLSGCFISLFLSFFLNIFVACLPTMQTRQMSHQLNTIRPELLVQQKQHYVQAYHISQDYVKTQYSRYVTLRGSILSADPRLHDCLRCRTVNRNYHAWYLTEISVKPNRCALLTENPYNGVPQKGPSTVLILHYT